MLIDQQTQLNTDKKVMQEKINQIAMQLQITAAEKHENDTAVKRLKTIIEEKDIQIEQLHKEIARIA